MINWVNDGQVGIARHLKCLVGDSFINTLTDQAEYALPVGMFEPIKVIEVSSGLELHSVEYRLLSRDNNAWRTITGTPYLYYFKGDKLGLYPKPSSDISNAYNIEYFRLPILLVDPSDDLEIPEFTHSTLVEYGIWKAKELLEDFDGASYFKDSFTSMLLNNLEEAANESTYPVIQEIGYY